MTNVEYLLFVLLAILLIFTLSFFVIRKCIDEYFYHKKLYNCTLDELISTVNTLIEMEFQHQVVLAYLGKRINMITDFQKVSTEICKAVVTHFDVLYTRRFVKSTGLNREFITQYIVKNVNLRLMEYMKTHTGKE